MFLMTIKYDRGYAKTLTVKAYIIRVNCILLSQHPDVNVLFLRHHCLHSTKFRGNQACASNYSTCTKVEQNLSDTLQEIKNCLPNSEKYFAGILYRKFFLFLDFMLVIISLRSRSSSVSTVSDYGLDDRTIEVRSPAGAKGFFSLVSVSRPSLLYKGYWGVIYPGVKRDRGVTLTIHPI
jgi:hypothetical protein